MRGEFHIHTTYSDGLLSVQEVLEKLKGNIDYFAITDHDYIDGSIEAYNKASSFGLKAIIGVEISSDRNGESVHVLGYFKNPNNLELLKNKLKEISNNRIKRMLIIKDKLKEYFDIDLKTDNLLKLNTITRGSIAREIIKQGYNYTMEELFQKVIGKGCKAYHPSTRISPEEAVELVHKCGGLAVLAHPVLLTNNDVNEVISCGFDGIEAIYPLNTQADEKRFREISKKKDIFITAGNDFHYYGDKSHADLLTLGLYDEELEIFIRKINELK